MIRFTDAHLETFSRASWDVNPLHLSQAYAHKTPFGERVVFGILGVASCLGRIRVPQGSVPSQVRVDFRSPLFIGADYAIDVKTTASGQVKAALLDGSAVVMTLSLRFQPGRPLLVEPPGEGCAPRQTANPLQQDELTVGQSARGRYAPAHPAYLELLDTLGIDRQQWGDPLLWTLLYSSYVTGMELPGERALYCSLKADLFDVAPGSPSDFAVTLTEFDDRMAMLASDFSLSGASGTYARGQIAAAIRPSTSGRARPAPVPGSGRFAGTRAVVIGASRGFGAALALELVAEGATVFAVYGHSQLEAHELLERSRSLPGQLILEQGRAADHEWCRAFRARIETDGRPLDLLICNAAPPLQPMRIEGASVDRFLSYVQQGLALVAAPLASFLDGVSAAGGSVLLVSSSAVEETPAVWPHYVAMKAAAEGLIRVAARSHPKVTFCIARPGKMQTDLTNTPMGWLDAELPEVVARRVLTALETRAPGTIQLCQ